MRQKPTSRKEIGNLAGPEPTREDCGGGVEIGSGMAEENSLAIAKP